MNILCGQQVPYVETWPASGMTRSGVLSRLPGQEPAMTANGSSSSGGTLPTPAASFDNRASGRTSRPTSGPHRGGIVPQLEDVAISLLPSPETGQTPAGHGVRGGKPGNGHQSGESLEQVAKQMLPTPRAARGASGTEMMYALGGERTDEGRPQGEVLLATPNSRDWKGSPGKGSRQRGGHQASLPADVENLDGESTERPSGDGKLYWDGQPLHQQSLDELDPAFLPPSWSG